MTAKDDVAPMPVYVARVEATPEGNVRVTWAPRLNHQIQGYWTEDMDIPAAYAYGLGLDPDDAIAVWLIRRPSDTRIVEVLDARLREHDALANGYAPIPTWWVPLNVDGYTVTYAEALEARRRLLAAKVKASDDARREADRRMVLGPIDDPEET